MKRHELIATILTDAAQGDLFPLLGMLDYLMQDCNIPMWRLQGIARRRFHLSDETTRDLIDRMYVVGINPITH